MPVRTTKARFKADLLRQAETLGGMGLTLGETAHALDIPPEVWARYTRSRPEFAAALERGQNKANAVVKQALYRRAIEGDATAQSLWMRHQQRGGGASAKSQSLSRFKIARRTTFAGLVPEDAPPKIKSSPNAASYVRALAGGWSLAQVSEYAERHFGEHISLTTFWELKQLIPVDDRIPPHYLDTVLRGLEVKVDGVAELQNLIAVQRIRVTEALHSDLDVAQVRAELDLLHRMVKDYTTMAVNLGLLKSTNGNGHSDVIDVTPVSEQQRVRNLALSMTPEQRAKLLATINEIRGVAGLSQQSEERFLVREQVDLEMLEPDSDMSAGQDIEIVEAATCTLTVLYLSVAEDAGAVSEAAEGAVPIYAIAGDACAVKDAASAEPDLLLLSVRDVIFSGDEATARRITEGT